MSQHQDIIKNVTTNEFIKLHVYLKRSMVYNLIQFSHINIINIISISTWAVHNVLIIYSTICIQLSVEIFPPNNKFPSHIEDTFQEYWLLF